MSVVPPRTGRANGRATLAMVAASAGVSIATVSKVLNGRSDVAPATRARVQDLLHEHDYAAPAPRRPESSTTWTIELVFDGDLGGYATEVIQGAVEAGAETGVGVVVGIRTPSGAATWVRGLTGAGRRAVVAVTGELSAAHLAALARARLPLVVLDPLNQPRTKVTSVGSTNFAGGFAATRHLLELGHRKIAYLGGHPTADCNRARLHGYRAALEGEGVHLPAGYVRHGHFLYQDGVEGGTALLALPDPPTAVFAASDAMALGVIEAARARGLRVPENLSLVGFDDTQEARMASPPLTTVRQPLREMGRVAVRTALRLAAGDPVDSHHVELATQLMVRESTAPWSPPREAAPRGVALRGAAAREAAPRRRSAN